MVNIFGLGSASILFHYFLTVLEILFVIKTETTI